MEIFLDTANLNEITEYKDFIDGVTTNPSLISKEGSKDYYAVAKKVCELVNGVVSIEVTANEYAKMLDESLKISAIKENICVKLPCTADGFRICKILSTRGVSTNMTLCFSPVQALLAAKCGATYVSPFIGRLDDIAQDGLDLIRDIVDMYEVQQCETRVLAASIRSVQHVMQVAIIGADAVTIPAKILKQCFNHPLTDAGLEIFARDLDKISQ